MPEARSLNAARSDDAGTPITLEVRGLSKSFGGLKALHDVSLRLHQAEVLGLVGDNGAGKSTLVNCISGGLTPDSGSILVDGKEASIIDPEAARRLGIETVYQDLALVDMLDVATNLYMNRELVRSNGVLRMIGWLDSKRMATETAKILDELRISVPTEGRAVHDLSGGQRQAVAVGRAVAWGQHIVLMDEPAAALGVEQSRFVMDLIRQLKQRGVSVILISHNMEHVMEVCDRVVVLRHGKKVSDLPTSQLTRRDLVSLITGSSESGGV